MAVRAQMVQGRLSFDALLQRIHPAESPVQNLSQDYRANLIVSDLLIFADWKLLGQPLKERRRPLQIFFAQYLAQNPTFQLSPVTHQIDIARRWMAGGRLDGIIAKRLDLTYQSGERSGMQKIKQMHTADCVQVASEIVSCAEPRRQQVCACFFVNYKHSSP